ncbi:regulation of nuclear pre-mRNA domain-containing protein 1B-like [Symsagittifera roscoffensis]|uniref:regulation of nuclear pre-mRNA domain-containing protein 1B-like n=1 Tax=Symsagittifera roscoffensis TaxID=84072 RepID=UPI00307BF975
MVDHIFRYHSSCFNKMGFKEEELSAKLSELNNTQQSIETLSAYIIHHRKYSKKIVKLWKKQVLKDSLKDRLALIFLANDVIQNSRKKTSAFADDFKDVLPGAFHFTFVRCKDSEKKNLLRVLDIWRSRGVFPGDFIDSIKVEMGGGGSGPPAKKKKLETADDNSNQSSLAANNEDDDYYADTTFVPDHEALIDLLTTLDTKAASGDRPIREKISKLPPEVQDTSVLDTINDVQAAEKLSQTVDEACALLTDYNDRLASEMEERRKAASWIRNFISAQQKELVNSEATLKEYKEKLEQVCNMRIQLENHINNLPDLENLKAAPLPSLNQLFKAV